MISRRHVPTSISLLVLSFLACTVRERSNPLDPHGTDYVGPQAHVVYPLDGDTLHVNQTTCRWHGNVSQCEYSYKLVYADSFRVHPTVGWSTWGSENQATFSNLDEENYTLAIKARIVAGWEQEEPSSVTFMVNAHPDTSLLVEPCSTSVVVGRQFPIAITIDGIAELMAGEINLVYSTSCLEIVENGVLAGQLLQEGGRETVFLYESDNKKGSLSINFGVAGGVIPGVSGRGTMAVVTFQAKTAGIGWLSFGTHILRDTHNRSMRLSPPRGGKINVQALLSASD